MKKLYVIPPIVAALVILGCSTTKPPTALEQRLFTVTTNYYPEIVVHTNLVTLTNTVIQTVQVTNPVGVVVPEYHTQYVTVPVTQITTNTVQVPAYTYAVNPTNATVQTATGVAGTIGNLVAPGLGGPIAGAIVPFGLAVWAWLRGSKKSATANNLAQSIETMREVIKALPNGAALDGTITTWMQNNQAATGVLPQVLDILNNVVDNQAAKQTADQLKAALAAVQNPRPPGAPTA